MITLNNSQTIQNDRNLSILEHMFVQLGNKSLQVSHENQREVLYLV